MKQSSQLARCATAAIAAALALGSTPLIAQSTTPATDPATQPAVKLPSDTSASSSPVTIAPSAPASDTAAAPATTAVASPAYVPPPTQVSEPVVQPVPVEPEVAPADTIDSTPAPTASKLASAKPVPNVKNAAAPAPAPVASTSSEPATDAAPIDPDAVVVAPPVIDSAAPATADEAQPATVQRDPVLFDLILFAGLILAALAVLFGLFRAFARRKKDRTPMAPAVAAPFQATKPKAVASRPAAAPKAEPARVLEPKSAQSGPIPIRPAAKTSSTWGALPSAGAAVDLPPRLPESFEERNALMKRMVDAPPDKANPFTVKSRRRKRARLILQSLGRKFENVDPWIDLSQYPNNWPELARRKYSLAA